MATPRIVGSESALSNEDLNEVELIHEVKLPLDFRRFLLNHNGGRYDCDVEYPLIDTPERGTGGFRYFCPVDKDESGEVLGMEEPEDLDIEGLLVFAEDESGELCVACGSEQHGRVFYVDFDRGLKQWFCLVAMSFTDFLSSIIPATNGS